VDARLGEHGGRRSKPAKPAKRAEGRLAAPVSWPTTFLALGSMAIGTGVTAVVLTTSGDRPPPSGQIFLALVIWIILGAINVAHARRR
jgi:hypothetical protein